MSLLQFDNCICNDKEVCKKMYRSVQNDKTIMKQEVLTINNCENIGGGHRHASVYCVNYERIRQSQYTL